ncbi:ADP-ribosylation factor GTPase-activating protein effector protein 1 [Monosporozyma unispora]|nr:hypothetical protein C6P44_000154 [Kazachstania unispora]
MQDRSKQHKKHFNELKFQSNNNKLLLKVQQLEIENLKCCDCQSMENVDWISINLLCVLCIKCSGVHRSLGSHISKIRSLTLDKFNDNMELLYLIENYTSNKFINEIYESNLGSNLKVTPNCNDLQRLNFISQKYKDKLFVKKPINNPNDFQTKSMEKFINALNSNNIWKLQYILSRLTKINLKQLSIIYFKSNNITMFQDSLKFNIIKDNNPLFIITEFLLWNDMIIDKDKDKCVETETNNTKINEYWNLKIKTFGTYDSTKPYKSPTSSPIFKNSNTLSQSNINDSINNNNTVSTNNIPSRSKSKKRWSLSYIPKSSTQNILTLHHALKSIKDTSTSSSSSKK